MTSLVDHPPLPDLRAHVDAVATMVESIDQAVSVAITGRHQQIRLTSLAVLAGGHVLVEDVPGVGKTLFAHSFARAIGGTMSRIQGTNDLLPTDVLGFMAPRADRSGFEFRPGPIFANVVLFDELNRTTPRTQSALFEVMEEGRVSSDGVSQQVPDPMVLIGTQNPTDLIGTHLLGEGAADRFTAAVSLGRASADEEVAIITGRAGRTHADRVPEVCTPDALRWAREVVARVHLPEAVGRYVVDIVAASRVHPQVRLGASTRAAVALAGVARAQAAAEGRQFVVPDDVHRHAVSVLAHRLRTNDGEPATARAVAEWCRTSVDAPRR
jgi:MoxR-like ATPase